MIQKADDTPFADDESSSLNFPELFRENLQIPVAVLGHSDERWP